MSIAAFFDQAVLMTCSSPLSDRPLMSALIILAWLTKTPSLPLLTQSGGLPVTRELRRSGRAAAGRAMLARWFSTRVSVRRPEKRRRAAEVGANTVTWRERNAWCRPSSSSSFEN